MKVQVVEEIPERYARRIAELLAQCFRVAELPEERRREHDDRFCSQADVWRHLLALNEGDTLVGFATVYRRQIERKGSPIVLGGLGDVCTDPDWRRRGIGTAMAAAATKERERAHCDMAYLSGSPLKSVSTCVAGPATTSARSMRSIKLLSRTSMIGRNTFSTETAAGSSWVLTT
jgi:GNAT superfamily N-acetyltransferase